MDGLSRRRSDGSKKPILIMGYTDVVGVQREKWTVDPFANDDDRVPVEYGSGSGGELAYSGAPPPRSAGAKSARSYTGRSVKKAQPASGRRTDLLICLLLLCAIFAAYSQVRHFDFVNYDDPDFASQNPHVRAGLTVEGAIWAFTSSYVANWVPLTWLSHMADCSLFGQNAGAHHLTNVFLHALSTLLLFAGLRRMTGARWPSALVACLFALHPLHGESVAWIAERKDVLSGVFWFLTIWVYIRYTERPGTLRYALLLAVFSLGLLAKPMLVTLPFVLLLLDVWPLGRAAIGGGRTRTAVLVREKAPLFVLAAAASLATYLAQEGGGAVMSLHSISMGRRVANAFVSYLAYLGQMVWPAGLAVFYPFPENAAWWQPATCALAVGGITIAVVRAFRRAPFLLVGWLWYLGTLVPVIGVFQVGAQAHADRYTYLPLVGIFIMLAWSAADATRRSPRVKWVVCGVSAAICAVCLVLTRSQVGYWRDSEALFQHAIDVTRGNYVAYNNLGLAERGRHRLVQAIADYREALRIRPSFLDAHNNLGEALLKEDRVDEATVQILEALRLKPDFAEGHVNMGAALDKRGQLNAAMAEYREALRLAPGNGVAHSGLGGILADLDRTEEAFQEMSEAIRLQPEYADGHYNLGWLLVTQGRTAEAIPQFLEAIRLDPDDTKAHYNLGTALAAEGRLAEAIAELQAALRLNADYAAAHLNLGKALANSGRMDEAATQFSEALRDDPNLKEARQALDIVAPSGGAVSARGLPSSQSKK
jgi:tetratricopeptide (TPR) repeat protein